MVCGGRDVGVLEVRESEHEVRLLQLMLLPDAQGLGIGSQVVGHVLREARGRPVGLRVLVSNPRAKAFWERHGFATVGETATHFEMRTANA